MSDIKKLADKLGVDSSQYAVDASRSAKRLDQSAERAEDALTPKDTRKYDKVKQGVKQITGELAKLGQQLAKVDTAETLALMDDDFRKIDEQFDEAKTVEDKVKLLNSQPWQKSVDKHLAESDNKELAMLAEKAKLDRVRMATQAIVSLKKERTKAQHIQRNQEALYTQRKKYRTFDKKAYQAMVDRSRLTGGENPKFEASLEREMLLSQVYGAMDNKDIKTAIGVLEANIGKIGADTVAKLTAQVQKIMNNPERMKKVNKIYSQAHTFRRGEMMAMLAQQDAKDHLAAFSAATDTMDKAITSGASIYEAVSARTLFNKLKNDISDPDERMKVVQSTMKFMDKSKDDPAAFFINMFGLEKFNQMNKGELENIVGKGADLIPNETARGLAVALVRGEGDFERGIGEIQQQFPNASRADIIHAAHKQANKVAHKGGVGGAAATAALGTQFLKTNGVMTSGLESNISKAVEMQIKSDPRSLILDGDNRKMEKELAAWFGEDFEHMRGALTLGFIAANRHIEPTNDEDALMVDGEYPINPETGKRISRDAVGRAYADWVGKTRESMKHNQGWAKSLYTWFNQAEVRPDTNERKLMSKYYVNQFGDSHFVGNVNKSVNPDWRLETFGDVLSTEQYALINSAESQVLESSDDGDFEYLSVMPEEGSVPIRLINEATGEPIKIHKASFYQEGLPITGAMKGGVSLKINEPVLHNLPKDQQETIRQFSEFFPSLKKAAKGINKVYVAQAYYGDKALKLPTTEKGEAMRVSHELDVTTKDIEQLSAKFPHLDLTPSFQNVMVDYYARQVNPKLKQTEDEERAERYARFKVGIWSYDKETLIKILPAVAHFKGAHRVYKDIVTAEEFNKHLKKNSDFFRGSNIATTEMAKVLGE